MIKGLKIAHLNVRSLIDKIDCIRIMLADEPIDIFCLSETWATANHTTQLLNVDGYSLVLKNRQTKTGTGATKRGGGIAYYVRDNVNFTVRTLPQMDVSDQHIECTWFDVNVKHSRAITVGLIYRPPSGSVDNFLKVTYESMDSLPPNNEIILIGDFNINYAKNDGASRKLKQLSKERSIKQIISEPTRSSVHGCSTIDLILTNSNYISHSGVLNCNLSDHDLIYMVRKKMTPKRKRTWFMGRSYKDLDVGALQNKLRTDNWDSLFNSTKPDDCWKIIIDKISEIANQQCPIKRINIKNVRLPWVTPALLELINDRDKATKKAKLTSKKEDWDIAKRLRNQTKTGTMAARAEYLKSTLDRYEGDPKNFWNFIGDIFPNTTKNKSTFRLTDINSGHEVQDEGVADYINNFFSSIGYNLAKVFDENWDTDMVRTNYEMDSIQTNAEEVIKLVNDINIYKSSCIENLSSVIMKPALQAIIPQLVHIFNLCFTYGVFPNMWKVATIIPLQKDGDTHDVNNLRPVSLLPLPKGRNSEICW